MKVNKQAFAIALSLSPISRQKRYKIAQEASLLNNYDSALLYPFSAWDKVFKIAESLEKDGIGILSFLDELYPRNLLESNDYPFVLYYKGNIELLKREFNNISIVGTRLPSPYGLEIVENFVPHFVKNNLLTVSGLASGIDAKVHRVTLDYGGSTIAVLGSGFKHFYPSSNKRLFDEILEDGSLVLTEYLPETKPTRYTFPWRNRIIAALSPLTLVVEANIKSGSLITARYATSYGRTVMACPGSIFNNYSAGTNRLIKYGSAIPFTELSDLLNEYNLATTEDLPYEFSELETKLLDTISSGVSNLNSIVLETGYSMQKVILAIEKLEKLSLISVDEFGLYKKL